MMYQDQGTSENSRMFSAARQYASNRSNARDWGSFREGFRAFSGRSNAQDWGSFRGEHRAFSDRLDAQSCLISEECKILSDTSSRVEGKDQGTSGNSMFSTARQCANSRSHSQELRSFRGEHRAFSDRLDAQSCLISEECKILSDTSSRVEGRVSHLNNGHFEWTIDYFYSVICRASYKIHIPFFTFANHTWYLGLFKCNEDNENWVKLIFRKKMVGSCAPELHVKLGIKTGFKGKQETHSGKIIRNNFYIDRWMPWSELLEERKEILSNRCLTVFCELRKLQGQHYTLKRVQEDFKNLLINGDDNDVIIKVQGKEFPAHRSILRARSPVFKSMFAYDMVEKVSGVVVIDDLDPVTFPDFLNYVYTGNTRQLCIENVFSLYIASDKYCMQELKDECMLFMKNSLSVNTFCDVITIAVRHNEKELIGVATDFFFAIIHSKLLRLLSGKYS